MSVYNVMYLVLYDQHFHAVSGEGSKQEKPAVDPVLAGETAKTGKQDEPTVLAGETAKTGKQDKPTSDPVAVSETAKTEGGVIQVKCCKPLEIPGIISTMLVVIN